MVDNGGIERFSCAVQYITDDVCACTILLPLKKMEWTMHSFYVTRRRKKRKLKTKKKEEELDLMRYIMLSRVACLALGKMICDAHTHTSKETKKQGARYRQR